MIINFTPHSVSIFTGSEYCPACRKYKGGQVSAVIPASGKLLNAEMAQEQLPMIEGITAMRTVYTASEFPELGEGEYALVSVLYLNAAKAAGYDCTKLLTPGPAVVDDTGRIIGCAWLNVNE